jgi:hypothetical protein
MKTYYDNSHLCGECTGAGCRQCKYTGVTRWPLSFSVAGVVPPSIKSATGNVNFLVRVTTEYSTPSDFYASLFAGCSFKSSKIIRVNKQAYYKGYN